MTYSRTEPGNIQDQEHLVTTESKEVPLPKILTLMRWQTVTGVN